MVSILALAISYRSHAQESRIYCYMQAGGGFGNFYTRNIGVTFAYDNWAGTLDLIQQSRKADDVPTDYHAGFSLSLQDGTPTQWIYGTCIEGGRIINFLDKNLRLFARGGVCIGQHEYPKNFVLSTGSSPNYQSQTQKDNITGLVLHPTIEWPCAVPFGISTGLRIIIFAPKTTAAIDMNILLGHVRQPRKKYKP